MPEALAVADLLPVLRRHLPARFAASEDILAGFAAALAAASQTGVDLVEQTTVDGGEGKWLTLHARGYGVLRATDETDASVRTRLQNVGDALTKTSILAAVNALLAPYTDEQATMIEWWESDGAFYLDDGDYLDTDRLLGAWHTFYLFLPFLGNREWGDFFLDSGFIGDAGGGYLGGGPAHPVYIAIIAAVERLRAAGTRWLIIYTDPVE